MNIGHYRDERAPTRETLANGIVLLSVPMPSAHSVTLGVWLRSGSQDESAALGGVAHFFEHMVFKGSLSRSAYEVAAGFDSLGVAIDSFTSKDNVAFTLKVLPEYFAPAATLLADVLLHPQFDPELLALEQGVVCEEIQETLDSPEERLHDAFAARIYGQHGRSRPILGSTETVRSFDAALLQREHRRLLCGENLVIAMAGNIDEAARTVVRDVFTELPRGVSAALMPDASVPAFPDLTQGNGRLVLHGPRIQSYFEIGNRSVSYLHEDRLAVAMLCNIFGGGMSSRVFQAVREREGLAYTIYNYSDIGRDIGLVSCAGSCSPDNLERLHELVSQQYDEMISIGPSEEELENNRAQFKSQIVFTLEGVLNQMNRAASNEIFFGRFVPVAEFVDRIDRIGRETIMRCAETYFAPQRLTFASHQPA